MIIAIIGSGNIGSALSQALIKAGHTVLVGTRFPLSEKSIKLATIIGEDRFNTVEGAVKQADVVIITTPPEAVLAIIPQLGDITGKVIIDTTNALRTKPGSYATALHAIKALAETEAVVKCFNTTGFENIINPVYNGQPIDMFVAGTDSGAKKIAVQLAKEIGFGNCFDFGDDDKVVLLEQLAFCWINLALMQGYGRNIALQVVKR